MRLYGLIGYPLAQSFSKKFFDNKFQREGLSDCRFENFELPSIDDLPRILENNPSLAGLAVTIPHKQSVMRFLDNRTDIPAGLEACNCISIRDHSFYGFNTDHIGFGKSLVPLIDTKIPKALVIGNGGASEAIRFALDNLSIQHTTVSRNPGNMQLGYAQVDQNVIAEHQLIINTTPLGMYPAIDSYPLLPYHFLTRDHLLYDLVYNPVITRFMEKGNEHGARTVNGQAMLEIQAEENWKIWNR